MLNGTMNQLLDRRTFGVFQRTTGKQALEIMLKAQNPL